MTSKPKRWRVRIIDREHEVLRQKVWVDTIVEADMKTAEEVKAKIGQLGIKMPLSMPVGSYIIEVKEEE